MTETEPALDTFNKATLHIFKGNHPFSFFFLILVLNLCACVCQLFCNAKKTFSLSWLEKGKKKRSLQMCVLKKHVSIPFDTAQDHPGLYRCELCQWFVTESRRRVVSVLFLQSNNTFLCVSLDDMNRDADEGGRAVWLLLSWVASFLFVLFDLCMNSNKTLAVFPHPCLFVFVFISRVKYFLQHATVFCSTTHCHHSSPLLGMPSSALVPLQIRIARADL